VKQYITQFPWRRDAVLSTLAYFDTLHFAPLVNAPTLFGVGLDDAVVPSRTVLAVVNRIRRWLEVRLLPVSHSTDAREALWQQFHEEWLGYIAAGTPADFGTASRQVGRTGSLTARGGIRRRCDTPSPGHRGTEPARRRDAALLALVRGNTRRPDSGSGTAPCGSPGTCHR
jgi:hypothetical protein